MCLKCLPRSSTLLVILGSLCVLAADDYNVLNRDGSFDFGYDNPDSFHHAQGNRNNIVRGEFGGRNPGTGGIDVTQYTAGPRGFRPRGKNIHRKYDFSQVGPRPVGSRDDPYYDPNEDPSYNFAFNTRTYSRQEAANRVGDVTGKYTYTDDIGERHNVEFIAGKNTGFHVKTPFPDSNPRAYGPLYFNGRGRPIPRGRTSIQRGLDGSYRFISAGPDQRRTETSDSTGHVRGSYTYLDDKGVQHSVHYIAGPETGYRVLKNVKGPHLPTIFPFGRPDIIPSDFYDYLTPSSDDVFSTAESGHAKPPKGSGGTGSGGVGGTGGGGSSGSTGGAGVSGTGAKPSRPGQDQGGDEFNFDDGSDTGGPSFGGGTGPGGSGGAGGTGSGSTSTGSSGGSGGFGTTSTGSGGSGGSTGFGTGSGGFGSKPGGSGSRPSRPFGGSRPSRPSYDDVGSDDFGDIFGTSETSHPKPPPGGSRPFPSGGGSGGSSSGGTDDGSYKPTGEDGSYRPGATGSGSSGRPGGDYGGSRPTGPSGGSGGGGSGGSGGGFPSSGKPGRPTPGRPGYDDGVNDLGVFDGSRPSGGSVGGGGSSVGGGGGSQIGISHVGGTQGGSGGRPSGAGGYDERGTIVTNVGDRIFSVPPGVSVRAHVQAIDLLPLGPRSPSPSEQLKAETSEEQLKAENSNISEELSTDASFTSTTITLPPSTTTTTTTTTSNSTEPLPL